MQSSSIWRPTGQSDDQLLSSYLFLTEINPLLRNIDGIMFCLQLVESVAICLTKIADQVSQSPAMLDQLCSHGLIHQSTHLLNLNSRTTLSQPVYNVREISSSFGSSSLVSIINITSLYFGFVAGRDWFAKKTIFWFNFSFQDIVWA